jgi:hypothetical protein
MNPGLVHIEEPFADFSKRHLWTPFMARLRVEKEPGERELASANKRMPARENGLQLAEETGSRRGHVFTLHAALCGETRGTNRLRSVRKTSFTSIVSASDELTGHKPFGVRGNTEQRAWIGRFGGR